VILGEGDSEQLVIPRIAEAMGVALDPSFVPVVPLGGRYVTHFWRLLNDLEIPHATLLDFDIGRAHGGANMIRSIIEELGAVGRTLNDTMEHVLGNVDSDNLDELDDQTLWVPYEEHHWAKALEELGVFLSDPLDLDFSMLEAFPDAYRQPHPAGTGPRDTPEALQAQKAATLKSGGDPTLYDEESGYDESFRWYPYLFLSRSKPDAHITALARITDEELAADAPAPLKGLIAHVKRNLGYAVNGE